MNQPPPPEVPVLGPPCVGRLGFEGERLGGPPLLLSAFLSASDAAVEAGTLRGSRSRGCFGARSLLWPNMYGATCLLTRACAEIAVRRNAACSCDDTWPEPAGRAVIIAHPYRLRTLL